MIFLAPHWESCGWVGTLLGLSPHAHTDICNHSSFPLYHPWFMSYFFLMFYSCLLHAGPHSLSFLRERTACPGSCRYLCLSTSLSYPGFDHFKAVFLLCLLLFTSQAGIKTNGVIQIGKIRVHVPVFILLSIHVAQHPGHSGSCVSWLSVKYLLFLCLSCLRIYFWKTFCYFKHFVVTQWMVHLGYLHLTDLISAQPLHHSHTAVFKFTFLD